MIIQEDQNKKSEGGSSDVGCIALIIFCFMFFWGSPDLYDLICMALEKYIFSK